MDGQHSRESLCVKAPPGHELWFQAKECTANGPKRSVFIQVQTSFNHATGDCACHSSKCPPCARDFCCIFLIFVHAVDVKSIIPTHHTSKEQIPAVGALTPRTPSSVWVFSQRSRESVAEGGQPNLTDMCFKFIPPCCLMLSVNAFRWHSGIAAGYDLSRLHVDLPLVSGIQCIHILP